MKTKIANFEITIGEEEYFDNNPILYRQVIVAEDGIVKMIGVVLDECEDGFELMRRLFIRLDDLLNLPLVNSLPEPLQTVVKGQEQSTYGMLFYDNEKGFPFTREELELLDKQINQYHLGGLIEINPDAKEGDPIITCFMSLCTYFNFLEDAD